MIHKNHNIRSRHYNNDYSTVSTFIYMRVLQIGVNEVLAFFLSKMFNHQIGTDTNKHRLMVLPYGVSLLQNTLQ